MPILKDEQAKMKVRWKAKRHSTNVLNGKNVAIWKATMDDLDVLLQRMKNYHRDGFITTEFLHALTQIVKDIKAEEAQENSQSCKSMEL